MMNNYKPKTITLLISILLLLSLFLISNIFIQKVSADGTDYYVSTIGSNSYNGLYPTYQGGSNGPWLTIEYAVTQISPGDTIEILSGVYLPASGQIRLDTFVGDADTWTTLKNYQDDVVIINGSNCPTGAPSFTFNAVIEIDNSEYIRISGLNINHSQRGAITIEDTSHHIRIDNCTLANSSTWAIKVTNGLNNITAEYNYVYNNHNNWSGVFCSQEVFSFENTAYFMISNNTFKDNRQLNIDIKGGGGPGVICYNTINTTSGLGWVSIIGYKCYGGSGVYLDARGTIHDLDIYNNNIYGNNTGIVVGTETAGGAYNLNIYNNIINMTHDPYGSEHGVWAGNGAISIAHLTGGGDSFHDINIYSNTFCHGANTYYAMFQVGSAANPFTSDQLSDIYIVNNIFYASTGYASTGIGFTILVYGVDYEDGCFILDSNLFYRPSYIKASWDGSIYYSSNPQGKFGTNPIFTNPIFEDYNDYRSGDLRLNSSSPCIDIGNETLYSFKDYDEKLRPIGEGYDIGAYEYGIDEPEPPSGDGYQYWSVYISDPDGDTTSGTIICSDGSSMSWTSEANGTQNLNMSNLEYGTNYTVWLNYTDEECSVTETYWFWTEFENEPNSPTSFTATTNNKTIIDLSWTKGTNTDKTYIRYKQGSSAPTDRSDGTFLYNDTGTSTSATGLSSGTEYSFKAWGWNETSSIFSTLSATDSASTLADTYITIRNDGIDYFVWLGTNTTAYYIAVNITGFDDASEYIAIWNNGTWSDTDGNWVKYYGDASGTNFNIHTFDVVSIYMVDVPISFPETQDYYMNYNPDMDYEKSYTHLWLNNSVTYGYNYTGYNKIASTTLGSISTSASLQSGEAIAVWSKSTYTWRWYLVGFWTPSVTVDRWDVIVSKVSATRTWNT